LAWAYQKSKCNDKKSGKRISRIIFRQGKGTFFGKEVLRKMCEKALPKARTEKGLIM
jgi:hypothetical protein